MKSYMNGIAITPIPFTNPLYPDQLHILIDPPAVLYTKGDQQFCRNSLKLLLLDLGKQLFIQKKRCHLSYHLLWKMRLSLYRAWRKELIRWRMKQQSNMEVKQLLYSDMDYSICIQKKIEHLRQKLAENHLLLTEYPPYVKPERWTFPMRNRIISGLSDAVVVTEAADKSGTMSTVEHALDHGKDIFAVPGPITSTLISRSK